jgi:hypothetical protein
MLTAQDIAIQIHKQLEEHIPIWVGKNISQIHPISNIQNREYSYIFLCTLVFEDDQDLIVRIKIPRIPGTMSIEQAMTDEAFREDGLREYTILQKMYAVVSREANSKFCAIQVLGYLSDFNAIVMVELPSRNLEEMIFDLRMRIGTGKFRQRFKNAMIESGRLLRLYHDHVGHCKAEPFQAEQFKLNIENSIDQLQQSQKILHLNEIQAMFLQVIDKVALQKVPYAALHRDFAFKNIVITPDDCVAVLDMDARICWERQPVYLDISRLITDLVAQKVKILSLGFLMPDSYLNQYEALFLQGYFGQDQFDPVLLAMYKALGILDVLNWYAWRIRGLRGIKQVFAKLVYPKMQTFLAHRALRYLQDLQN